MLSSSQGHCEMGRERLICCKKPSKENSAGLSVLGLKTLKPPRSLAIGGAQGCGQAQGSCRWRSWAAAWQCCYKVIPEISSSLKGINRNEARTPRRSQMGSTHVKAQFILSVRSILGSSVFSASSVWELFYTSWQIFGLGVSKYNLSD